MRADLHIHTNFSDGSDSIGQVIEIAKEKKLDAIAITDHDTVDHLEQITEESGVQVIGGVEISAIHKATNTRAHILGYNIKKPEIIAALTQPLLKARNKNSEKQAKILIDAGFRIDIEMLPRADGKYLYKQHILDSLVKTGQVPDMFGDFYQKTFKNDGICAFDIEYIDVFEAVSAVKRAGGLAVLAHPGQQQNFRLIPELAGSGLDGLELNHHSHSGKDRTIIRDYVDRYGLFLTGGSDYHGKYEPRLFGIGDYLSDISGVNVICQTMKI